MIEPNDPILKYAPLFGVWRPVEFLGGGSYGRVYRVEQSDEIGTSEMAVKMIVYPKDHEDFARYRNSREINVESIQRNFDNRIEMFRREVSSLESLRGNVHIVQYAMHKVYKERVTLDRSVGEVDQWIVFILMELLTPLNIWLREKNISEQLVIKIGVDILTALEYCANKGIIHRDIKMDNVLVNKNDVFKLGDFGESRFSTNIVTRSHNPHGAEAYAAPETIRGEFSIKSDMYSLGIMMYYLLNEETFPYMKLDDKNLDDVEYNNACEEACRTRNRSTDPLPPPINGSLAMKSIIVKCCHPDTTKRYHTPTEMKQALEGLTKTKKSKVLSVLVDKWRYIIPALVIIAILSMILILKPWNVGSIINPPTSTPTASIITTPPTTPPTVPPTTPPTTPPTVPPTTPPTTPPTVPPTVPPTSPPPTPIDISLYTLPGGQVQAKVTSNEEIKLMLAPSAFATAMLYDNRSAVNIQPGDDVSILWKSGDWVFVVYESLEGNMYGYIPSAMITNDKLSSIEPMPNVGKTIRIIQDTYIRSQPNKSSRAIKWVTIIEKATLIGFSENGWAYVKHTGGTTVTYGFLQPDAYIEVN